MRRRRRFFSRATRRGSPLIALLTATAVLSVAIILLPAQRGAPPPDLTLPMLDGRKMTLAELRGKPALFTFWATSCAPCVEEVPALAQLYRELAPRGLALIAVAVAYDPPLSVARFVERRELPYPVALDVTGEIAGAFGDVAVIPTAVLLDPEGEVAWRYTGMLDIARARRMITRFLPREGAP